jgi:hypothetical protein
VTRPVAHVRVCVSACAVVARGSWLVARGSWLVARGSWLVARERASHVCPGEVAYIPSENRPLQALGRVNLALAQAVATRNGITRATLDHDATVCESHKREAKAHYKDGRGYQPT